MKIVVCVKFVPDLQSDRGFTEALTVARTSDDGVLNELDENALEFAVSLIEDQGSGDDEVIALTMGPDDAEAAVRKALQMGADRAVHVCDDAIAGSDVFGTARVLAAAIQRIGAEGAPVDLVLTGMAALDSLTSLLPTALAASLGWPQATLAIELAVDGNTVTAKRSLDGAEEIMTTTLPAVCSVTDQINEPRYPNFKAIMAAKKKSVEVLGLADLGIDPGTVGTSASWTQVVEAVATPPRAQGILVTDDGSAGANLADYLVENHLA